MAISRMKSLVSPALLTFAPNLSKPTIYFPSCFQPIFSHSLLWTSRALQTSNFLHFVTSSVTRFSLKKSPEVYTALDLQTEAASQSQLSSGEIHVIIGPMFAGKTTTLLRRIKAESGNGRSVAIIKSNKDTRYGLDSVVTHDGEKLPCWSSADLSLFRQKFGSEAYDKLEVIGIDEAQFFEDLYDFCSNAADNDGKIVIVAGLDGDYLRQSFGSVLDLIPIADSVTKLSARCELCGKRAFFTLRKTEETQTELIAGADVYMPVCRKHYVSGQVAKVATRTVLESQKVECTSFM